MPRSFQHCNRPSTVTQCDASRQNLGSGEAGGCRFAFRNPVVQASLVCSLTISSTSCQSVPRRRSSSSVLNAASSARVGPASWTGSLSANRSLVFRFACLEKEGNLSKTEKRTKVEEIEKGDNGPPTRKVCC